MNPAGWLFAVGLALATALAVAAHAMAGTASVSIGTDTATLAYLAAPGERNRVTVAPDDAPGAYRLSDRAGTRAGFGCEPFSGDPSRAVRCFLPQEKLHRASVRVGDRNDDVDLRRVADLAASIAGGAGHDTITGPGNGDQLLGIPGWLLNALGEPEPRFRQAAIFAAAPSSSLLGGPGVDMLWGGSGDDVIVPGGDQDYVRAAGGDDRIIATDAALDYIHCDRGRDRLKLGRLDFAWGRCGTVRRRGTPVALPLSVDIAWQDADQTFITIGCPFDMPTACRGRLVLAPRGLRPVFQKRFHLQRGRAGGPTAELRDADNKALAARGARLLVQARDAAGHIRSASRLIHISPEPAPARLSAR